MKQSSKALLSALITILIISNAAPAQEKRPEARPTGLAIGIKTHRDSEPNFSRIPAGFWSSQFLRDRPLRHKRGELPTKAVKVDCKQDDDGVKVIISAILGLRFHDKVEQVASYKLKVNEEITVSGLGDYDIEPFQMRLIRVEEIKNSLPAAISHAQSVIITRIEPVNDTFPAYKVSIKNLSASAVVALDLQMKEGERPVATTMQRSLQDHELIKPGDEHTIIMREPVRFQALADGHRPELFSGLSVVVRAALFYDGTFEGDNQSASIAAGFRAGNKLQLTRAINLLEALLESEEKAPAAIDRLKSQVDLLDAVADLHTLVRLEEYFLGSTLTQGRRIRYPVEASMNYIKREILNDVAAFEREYSRSGGAADFYNWLMATIQKYKARVSRL
jgi:hypothetical protein